MKNHNLQPITYEPVIGLEVHIELKTLSKMFCRCSADYFWAKPNTHTCPVCLGLPGAMPVANQKAIEYAQKFGLALGCDLSLCSKFDRKNYFYPDLAKGFQISQYELPFSKKGSIEINVNESRKRIGITRAHLEEDTAKLTHAKIQGKNVTLIDFNRSGVPLLEIVSEPDIRSALEAKIYAQKLQQLARYLQVSDADMEKGSMRIEPNVSLLPLRHDKILPPYKVELKNINSFRFVEKAINFEIERQSRLLDKGEKLSQETRGWDEKEQKTVSQRTKEEAHDYRYFPEPELPPLNFAKDYPTKLKKDILELPDVKIARFQKIYSLSSYDCQILTQDQDIANFFEEAVKAYGKNGVKKVTNWVSGEFLRRLNEKGKKISEINLLPASLAELLYLIDKGEITQNTAKDVFAQMIETGQTAKQAIGALGFKQLSQDELEKLVEKVINENKKAIADYQSGKQSSIDFLIGQIQRQTKGQANAVLAKELILKKLTDK